jgi:LAS superfamily LD-carboxypeptidase LdcB
MKRKEFIKLSALGSLALSGMSFNPFQEELNEEVLTGRTTSHLNANGIIHKLAYKAFLNMKAAAAEDGINIEIVSGFRSFERQTVIWNRKYNRYKNEGLTHEEIVKEITLYSTIPGTSRHHWGTDIDVIDANAKRPNGDVLEEENYHGDGPYCRLKMWMEANAEKFGFLLVYDTNYYRTGFNYEPWHYSYAILAKDFLKNYLRLDIKKLIYNSNMKGKSLFTDEQIKSYIESHVKGINPALLPS